MCCPCGASGKGPTRKQRLVEDRVESAYLGTWSMEPWSWDSTLGRMRVRKAEWGKGRDDWKAGNQTGLRNKTSSKHPSYLLS